MQVCILAVDGKLRNPGLLEFLKSRNVPYKVIQGINGRLFDKSDFLTNNLISKRIFFNKFVTSEEVSCAVGHLDIYKYLLKNKHSNSDWNLIIEDDAMIDDKILNISKYFDKAISIQNKPIVISCYSESFVTLNFSSFRFNNEDYKLNKCLIIPSGTVAYFVNKKFIDDLKHYFKVVNDKADWPAKIYKKSLFFLLIPSLIQTNNHKSKIRTSTTNNLVAFHNKGFFHKFSRILNYRYTIYELYTKEFKIIILYLFNKKFNYFQKGFW